MRPSTWRQFTVGILCVALFNLGLTATASAAIVDTATLAGVDREADLDAIRVQLERADVRAQMEQMGVEASAIDQRLASLSDRELRALATDMREAPAGGDILGLVGAVFVVLLILELVGVIDIFKTVGR